jgi:origin recognition complex subunit 5
MTSVTHDPHELASIAAARWPGFVKPVLDANKRDMDLDADSDSEGHFQPARKSLHSRRYSNSFSDWQRI